MTTPNLKQKVDAILEAAGKATPGPWKTERRDFQEQRYFGGTWYRVRQDSYVGIPIAGLPMMSASEKTQQDIDFIAACDPTTIAPILTEWKRMREDLEMVLSESRQLMHLLTVGTHESACALRRSDYIVCPNSMDEPILNAVFRIEARVRRIIG